MDKITEEVALLKRVEEVVLEIRSATSDLSHSSKDVQLITLQLDFLKKGYRRLLA